MTFSSLTRGRVTAAAVVGVTLLATALAGCTSSGGNNTASGPYSAAKGCTNIGFLLPESDTSARWEANDRPEMQKAIQQYLPGATLSITNANGSDSDQLAQAEGDLTKGACILIVAPHDSQKAATIVEKALAQHVPVIAYDRLIQDKNTAFYVSFDNVKVGNLQGQYIADNYQSYVTQNGNNNLVMISGSQTDNNAILFSKGAHQALDPLISGGKLNKVYETYTPDWNNATAQSEMDGALTKNGGKVAVAYVANDGMAGTVIAALKQNNLAGKVLVTGQDATTAGLTNILLGYQSMTVYKAISKEAQAAAQLAAALSKGQDTASLTNGATTATQDGGNLPSVLETPVAVDKNNIASTVLADGFVTKEQICQGVPAGTDNIC
ncbi:MAG TPA: substrate-binding domain-containing protein [Ktedonobacterales bacterium]|nr:substrate-binding domain-containing protein [Ktedonobacterales bacterium]